MAENQVAVIQNSMDVFKTAPEILLVHQSRTAKALKVADEIIEEWNTAFAIQDPEAKFRALAAADERSNKFLANCTAANTQMKESRAAITQLMDMVREMYTTEENALDPKKGAKPAVIQGNRNQFAKLALEEAERKRKAAAEKMAKDKEEVEIRTAISSTISQMLIDNLADRKLKLTESFNKITLETFIDKSLGLRSVNPGFPVTLMDTIRESIKPRGFRHSEAEILAIKNAEFESYDFGAFAIKHAQEIAEFKQSLVDRLQSKKAELEEQKRQADQAEADRKAEVERQRLAEEKRQEDIRKANAEEKVRLEKKAEEDRKKEAERLAEMNKKNELDQANQREAQKKREEEERNQIAQSAEEDRKKSEEAEALKKTSGEALALFTQAADATGSVAPEVRTGIEITVLHHAGWIELIQFWFMKEGVNKPLDDFEKMTFNKVKAFAEKAAKDTPKKNGERIDSKNLSYSDSVTSVNRKAKANV